MLLTFVFELFGQTTSTRLWSRSPSSVPDAVEYFRIESAREQTSHPAPPLFSLAGEKSLTCFGLENTKDPTPYKEL